MNTEEQRESARTLHDDVSPPGHADAAEARAGVATTRDDVAVPAPANKAKDKVAAANDAERRKKK